MDIPGTTDLVDNTAHIVQVALTPIFLLTGVGTLLNVFNARLARVADHNQLVAQLLRDEKDERELASLRVHRLRLQRRLRALDVSVALTAIAGAATCGTAFILFIGSLHDQSVVSWLVISFGVALVCIVCALMSFVVDTLLAWHGRRQDGPLPHPPQP